MTENNIAEKQIRVEKTFPEDVPFLEVDPAMLEQAFLNIYRNAIDAMEEGGTLRISARQENNQVRVEISDDGCGIPRDDMPHIFNPFFTSKSAGTGLGLTQIKKIIDMHQGTIEISSEEGKGTNVVVTFPIETAEKHSSVAP
jgi:signal transduction histidine kinase